MGERRPSCHYIPPDFDPTKPAKRSKPLNGQHDIRFMLPFSVQCTKCGDYMFQGTKCNARKELVYKEFYLGTVNVYRIYIHCKACYSEITIKTDPKACDYVVEHGGIRSFEPWHDLQVEIALQHKKRFKGEDVETTVEKVVDAQHEMEEMRELERIRSVTTIHNTADLDDVLSKRLEDNKLEHLTPADEMKIATFASKIDQARKDDLSKITFKKPLVPVAAQWKAPSEKGSSLLSYEE